MARSALQDPAASQHWQTVVSHKSDRFVPFYGDSSAVDIRRSLIFEILQTGVARLLSIAGLEAKVEETTNAVLSGGRRVVHDEAEAGIRSATCVLAMMSGLTLCTCQCLAR